MSEILPRAGIVMGSDSDWPTMKEAADLLAGFELPYEKRVVSAHRTPDLMAEYGKNARERGIEVITAGAGGAAHLPGMRSEERSVGKECRRGWWEDDGKKKRGG